MGFDWDDYQGVIAKVTEELRELESAESDAEREQELGDLLFSLVNVSRWLGIQAETALRQSNGKFYSRFVRMERLARGTRAGFRGADAGCEGSALAESEGSRLV